MMLPRSHHCLHVSSWQPELGRISQGWDEPAVEIDPVAASPLEKNKSAHHNIVNS